MLALWVEFARKNVSLMTLQQHYRREQAGRALDTLESATKP